MMRRRISALAFVLGVSVLVAGCVQEVPLVSEPRAMSGDTLDEQLTWVEQQADAAIAAAGVTDGWYWGGNGIPEFSWTDNADGREPVRGSLLPTGCGHSGGGQLYLGLKNVAGLSDPSSVADRVRAFWESEGWTVADVTPPTDEEQDFRADRPDGALLGFTASTTGMVISVHTSCSVHDTVTNWEMYRDRPNPFSRELERRELERAEPSGDG